MSVFPKIIYPNEKADISNQQIIIEQTKNVEPNNKGFSSYQIVYGANPRIPGILDGNPASLSNDYVSIDVKTHIARVKLAREAFRTADNDEKLKRALKMRINPSFNEVFEHVDEDFFKEKKRT